MHTCFCDKLGAKLHLKVGTEGCRTLSCRKPAGERGTSPRDRLAHSMGAAVHSLRFRRQAIVGIVGAMVTLLAVPLALRAAAKSDPTIQAVGSPMHFSSASAKAATTAVPSGVVAGDVLVSYIETPASAAITCAAGWTKQLERASTTARLAACTKVAGAAQAQPSATVTPATNVSMVTLAYSGVDTTHPVASAAAALGLTGPAVTPSRAGSLLVLGQGSDHWRVTFLAPTGATRRDNERRRGIRVGCGDRAGRVDGRDRYRQVDALAQDRAAAGACEGRGARRRQAPPTQGDRASVTPRTPRQARRRSPASSC